MAEKKSCSVMSFGEKKMPNSLPLKYLMVCPFKALYRVSHTISVMYL